MDDSLRTVLSGFCLDSFAAECERYGCGHINETYLAVTASGRRYILQRINDRIFRDVDALMENICAVTAHLRMREPDPRRVLRVVPTVSGGSFLRCGGGCWRVYDFVEGSVCLQSPESPRDFYESAVGFGRFSQLLADFPAAQLRPPIPRFHDTPDRYRIFRETLREDVCGRAKRVQREIDFYLAREEEMGTLQRMLDAGELPLHVTHNDTKLNNVLLDSSTRRALCVIDLDTVMPGSSLYDYGDSIRFGAATAAEDEPDFRKAGVDLELFRTFTLGYCASCPGLTQTERAMLPMGAKTMTLECGLRFLTDYLDGDHYFAFHREGHNLDRSRTQMRMVEDMEGKWDAMRRIAERPEEP